MANHKPDGTPGIVPYLMVRDAPAAIAFAREVLGAQEVSPPLLHEDGSVWNAELRMGDARIYIASAQDEFDRPGFLYIYVEDCDATYEAALAHGAKPFMPPGDRFYGARDGGVIDDNGTVWWFGTHLEDVDHDGLRRRAVKEDARRTSGA